jgi:transcriptional regulator with XRE-family HTH domain
MKTSVPYEKVFSKFPPARQRKIKARAAELIAEEYALRDLRLAKEVTQEQVAERLGGRQVYVSRLEKRADMKLSTLRNYVRAIGGDLQLMVTFPEGKAVKLRDIGTPKATRQRRKPIGRTARRPAAHVGRAPSR